MADTERAHDALHSIPPDCDRETWVRVGMAAQAAGLGFDDFDAWSAGAGNYDAAAARDTWRSIKPGKGVGAGTLYRMAAENGWRKPQQKAAQAPRKAPEPQRKPAPGMGPGEVWARCQPATWEHAYIRAKGAAGVPLDALRVVPAGDPLRIQGERMAGALVVPAFAPDGSLRSLQCVTTGDTAARLKAKGKKPKLNLPGAPMAAASFTVGEMVPGAPVYIVEGVGTAWACWQATGHPAVVCFGWGNVGKVARAIHERDNAARLVLVPDVGKEEAAERIARELGCSVACMPEGEPQNFDCNDLAQRDGADVLAALLEAAQDFAPRPLLVPVDVVNVLREPSPPPRWVWDGYLPAGEVALLGAHGGTGKSTIALMLAVAVAAGRPLFGVATEPGPVLFASLEDGAHVVRHRLATICQQWNVAPEELANLRIVDGTANPELFESMGRDGGSTTRTYAELQELARGCALVIADNASDAYGGDEIQRRPVRGFIRALGLIAKANDCAVLLLAHVDKGTSRKERIDTEGYSGSTAWNNSVRSRLFMARSNDGALELSHQKSNHGKLREPLRLFWPDGGLPQVDSAPTGVVAHIADSVNTKALLKLIAEFSERGEYVSTATTSRTHAAKLLAGESTYPKNLKPGDVFDLLRRAERAGQLQRSIYRGGDRKPRECWAVTPQGRELAGLPAATAATAATSQCEEVTAPDAEACGDCGDSARGYGGKSAHTKSPQTPVLVHDEPGTDTDAGEEVTALCELETDHEGGHR